MKLVVAWLLLAAATALRAAGPVPLIYDTDMGNDIDDALALAVIHALESRGECRLIGVTLTKDNPWAAPYVDLVNTFYGRPNIPIGAVRNGKTPQDGRFLRAVAQQKTPAGEWVYPRRLRSGEDAPEAVKLLRRLLAAEADGSVVIAQVGFSTNLARLLDSPPDEHSPLPGKELAKAKVRLLSLMGGAFPPLLAEYNIRTALDASTQLFAQWPREIVVSGFEIGKSILYPAQSIEDDFSYAKRHPVAEAYRAYDQMPYGRPTWDLTSVLYAIRPSRGYFGLSPQGRITVDAEGYTRFSPDDDGPHRFLTATPAQRERVLGVLTTLASQPPGPRP